MNTKLTLTLEEEIISKAKKYAKSQGESLSGLIEAYLTLLTKDVQDRRPTDFSPKTRALFGAVTIPEDYDEKKELEKAILEKYNG